MMSWVAFGLLPSLKIKANTELQLDVNENEDISHYDYRFFEVELHTTMYL